VTTVHGSQLIVTAIVVTFLLVALILVWALVGSAVIQRRRYLRTRTHLGGRLLTAQDEERAAIARELHDDTVQRLITIASRLRTTALPEAGSVATELDGVTDNLRAFARGIHPTLIDHVSLESALRDLTATFAEREGIAVEFECGTTGDNLPPSFRLAFYRVAQEALGNVARHAAVRAARVEFCDTATMTRLIVQDAGPGFNPRTASSGYGIGITSMQERLSLLGGALTIDSSPGHGTRVIADLPRKVP
jgi:signal transduction histidine kinase